MTNEEEADVLSYDIAQEYDSKEIVGYHCALEMAQWKDEQFDEEKKELLGLVNMLSVNEHNQTIIEDLKALLQ